MLILLSPSKTQNFETAPPTREHTLPYFLDHSRELIPELRALSKPAIARLMAISPKLAALNHDRYRAFTTPFTLANAKQAIFAFQGDVYDGFDVASLDENALDFAQIHIRILSGLYGVLRPLDLIQPYRLEMKIPLKNKRGKDLYAFWGKGPSEWLREELATHDTKVIINLASQEYFKVIDPAVIGAPVITPQFKEKKGNNFKMIALFAKQARGRMAHYIAKQHVTTPDALRFFAEDGYRLNVGLSTPDSPVYTRG